jgi:hypothetical protein
MSAGHAIRHRYAFTAFDDGKNIDPAHPDSIQRLHDPISATRGKPRFSRVFVLRAICPTDA